MKNIDYIFKAVEWIENNLKEDRISVENLARLIGYSPYHFSRLFHGVTGLAPKDYIMKRKLTEAAKEIRSNRRRIIDIAFDFHFGDHETFSRAFKKLFGVNPIYFRKNGIPEMSSFFLEPIKVQDMNKKSYSQKYIPEIISLSEKYLVGFCALISATDPKTEKQYIDIQNHLNQEKNNLHNINSTLFYQIGFWPDQYEIHGYYVFRGLSVTHLEEIPVTMVGKIIPKSNYLHFRHKGSMCAIDELFSFIYSEYLPSCMYKPINAYNLMTYEKEINEDESYFECEIYIPIEKMQ